MAGVPQAEVPCGAIEAARREMSHHQGQGGTYVVWAVSGFAAATPGAYAGSAARVTDLRHEWAPTDPRVPREPPVRSTRIALTALLVASVAVTPAAASAVTPAAGRNAFTLSSTAFANGGVIPKGHECTSGGRS